MALIYLRPLAALARCVPPGSDVIVWNRTDVEAGVLATVIAFASPKADRAVSARAERSLPATLLEVTFVRRRQSFAS
jgi:hypothetical protein